VTRRQRLQVLLTLLASAAIIVGLYLVGRAL
jgi:hypothetical protein